MTIPFYLIILADNAQCNPFFKKKFSFQSTVHNQNACALSISN